METSYRRLDFKSRIAIYYLSKQGCSQREISRQLEVSPSTICRELKRNKTGKLYFPEAAQHKAQVRKKVTMDIHEMESEHITQQVNYRY